MNTPRLSIALLSVPFSFGIAGAIHAQTPPPKAQAGGTVQQSEAGAPPEAATCAGCHGANGEGNAASGFPRIAGQSQTYLARQLTYYANGQRANQVMSPIAKGLTPQQIETVSAYYASLAVPAAKPAHAAQENLLKRGQQLVAVGDNAIGVQACANCHGPGGAGQPPTYPYLASQHANYLTVTLGEWKKGARNTDPSQQMQTVAKRLSDQDINAVAVYFASQPAPAPAASLMNTPSGSTAKPAAPAPAPSPKTATPATKGIGTGQGAPTTGGAQGPGGGGGASGSGPSGSPSGAGQVK